MRNANRRQLFGSLPSQQNKLSSSHPELIVSESEKGAKSELLHIKIYTAAEATVPASIRSAQAEKRDTGIRISVTRLFESRKLKPR